MARTFLAVLSLLTLSCAGSPAPSFCLILNTGQKVRELASLIKAESFDEAAAINPDLLARAFVEALREMKAESADPKRRVRVADFFFDNYPFCANDLMIDESMFEAISEARFEAMNPPPSEPCGRLEAAKTLEDKLAVLEGWESLHDDGGRCARGLAGFFRRSLKAGPEWDRNPDLAKNEKRRAPSGLARELMSVSGPSLAGSPHFFLMAMTGCRVMTFHSFARAQDWRDFRNELGEGRWRRPFHARAACLDALRTRPFFDFGPAGEELEKSRHDPRLRELGSALRALAAFGNPQNGEVEDAVGYEAAVMNVIRRGRGTPFADAARYGWAVVLSEQGRPHHARVWVREHRADFDHPLRAAYSLLYSLDWEWGRDAKARESEESLKQAQEVLDWSPGGSSAVSALNLMAAVHLARRRFSEAVACLKSAVAIPRAAQGPLEDETAEFARSEAGRTLARHYGERHEWEQALKAWNDWENYTWCATCSWALDEERDLGMARALEHLGRVSESAECYWRAAIGRGSESVETAKKLVEIHRSLGTLPDLTAKVKAELKGWDQEPNAGLQKLATELGVPLK